MFKKVGLSILIIGFLTYGVAKSIHIFRGESVNVSINTSKETLYTLSGIAPHTKSLLVNGTPVSTNLEGDFTYDFSPLPGFNVMTVESTDIFGNNKEKVYSFVYNNANKSVVSIRTQ